MSPQSDWSRFVSQRCELPELGLTLDYSRLGIAPDFIASKSAAIEQAFQDMDALEAGSMANPDEERMVGHYWLRNPSLARTPEIADAIRQTLARIHEFAAQVHQGALRPPRAERFTHVLSIGIGGSALGPMFVGDALGGPGQDRMRLVFLDNTDPDGIARELKRLDGKLAETLVLVISKGGSTPETRNGMIEAEAAFERAGLKLAPQAVAITGEGSQLDKVAIQEGWLARFPMWDWVGGRTSQTSAVGLLPAALQGLDIEGLLAGAAACDQATRGHDTLRNPAALMALCWHAASEGHGSKDMVVLPYKDRLLLLGRYLQQLVMESLGKRLNRKGDEVLQGLTVYGNKGSTDQHAYVQQLRDGLANFFVTFIRVLEDGGSGVVVQEPSFTAGDFLHGFLLGTRAALAEEGRGSITLTVPRVDAWTIGVLIALYERTVGLYASLVGINAYHQPGVEAGKKAAATVLEVQQQVAGALSSTPQTAPEVAQAIGKADDVETVYLVLEHLAANGKATLAGGSDPASRTFQAPG